jgi:zinc knuckle protein
MQAIDDRIAVVKDLIKRREEIDAELSALLGVSCEPSHREAKAPRRCSICGESGHRATTCPQTKPESVQAA